MARTETRDGMDNLVDYILQTASRGSEALSYEPRKATLKDLAEGDTVIVETPGQARFSVLLAEALVAMSQDIHAEDERVDLSQPMTTERAIILVKEYGGLRPAARATGISRSTFWRALKSAREAGAFV
jgi:transcriptional regulator of acetoin/glycerol metabolism